MASVETALRNMCLQLKWHNTRSKFQHRACGQACVVPGVAGTSSDLKSGVRPDYNATLTLNSAKKLSILYLRLLVLEAKLEVMIQMQPGIVPGFSLVNAERCIFSFFSNNTDGGYKQKLNVV